MLYGREEFHGVCYGTIHVAWNCGAFLVIEAVTVGLTTIWFAGGALVAAVASGLGASQAVQWILFLPCR